MNNWAVIIGVDNYPNVPQMNLKGAVRDALRMREWLLAQGGVPETQMRVLLSPHAAAVVPPSIKTLEATHDQIVKTIYELLKTSGGNGDRFFFHYSGHGLMSRIAFSNEEALIPSDFEPILTTKSISFRSILEQFEAASFAEQFFFFDACRNMPWDLEFEIGRLPLPATPDPTRGAPQQFVMLATSPGLKASELALSGNEAGAFTDALLDGLDGKGKAKMWDEGRKRYVIRFDRLFDYVVSTVAGRALPVGQNNRRIIQVPRRAGEQGQVTGNNPILAEMDEAAVGKEPLEVNVAPFNPPTDVRLTVAAAFASPNDQPVATVPFRLELPPREYLLTCVASGYEEEPRPERVIELYEPKRLDLRLRAIPLPPPPPPPPPAAPAASVSGGVDFSLIVPGATRRSARPLQRAKPAQPQPASIVMQSSDSMAPLELRDPAGKSIAFGFGKVERSQIPPGLYQARLSTPEGENVQQWVTLAPGEQKTLNLQAPPVSDAVLNLARQTGFGLAADNSMLVSETAGPLASVQLSTVLALAGVAANRTSDTHRLRSLGVDSFAASYPGADRGVQCLIGDESNEGDPALSLHATELGLWPQSDPVPAVTAPVKALPNAMDISQFTRPTTSGPYWLSFSLPGQKPIVMNVVSLDGRVTLVVVHRGIDGAVAFLEYMPSFRSEEMSKPRDMRALELMQRFYNAGSYATALDTAKELLQAKFIDPIAGCLGAYLMIRLGRTADLSLVSDNMLNFYGELPDSHVIAAAHAESRKRPDDAAAHMRRALDRGLPLFADGLRLMAVAVAKQKIDHSRTALVNEAFNRRVQGMLWTAWSPEKITPGLPLGA